MSLNILKKLLMNTKNQDQETSHPKSWKERKTINGESHTRVTRELTVLNELPASYTFIYSIIRLCLDNKTYKAKITIDKLIEKTGYKRDTIMSATRKLAELGFFEKKSDTVFPDNRDTPLTYNTYIFPKVTRNYENHTRLFLENPKLDRDLKEFILLLQPHIYRNKEAIGYSNTEIAERTGIDRGLVGKRINALKDLGYWFDKSRKERIIRLTRLQLKGGEAIAQERNELRNENLELRKEIVKLKSNN